MKKREEKTRDTDTYIQINRHTKQVKIIDTEIKSEEKEELGSDCVNKKDIKEDIYEFN